MQKCGREGRSKNLMAPLRKSASICKKCDVGGYEGVSCCTAYFMNDILTELYTRN